MHVTVCIVGFRNPADIAKCLAALAAQTHSDFAVVICENGPDQDFVRLCSILPDHLSGGQSVDLLHDASNPGYAGGVNRCIAARPSSAAYWILNPDTEPNRDALAALVARLEKGDVAAVGGVMYLPGGQVSNCGGNWNRFFAYSRSIGLGRALTDLPDAAEVKPSCPSFAGDRCCVRSSLSRRPVSCARIIFCTVKRLNGACAHGAKAFVWAMLQPP